MDRPIEVGDTVRVARVTHECLAPRIGDVFVVSYVGGPEICRCLHCGEEFQIDRGVYGIDFAHSTPTPLSWLARIGETK